MFFFFFFFDHLCGPFIYVFSSSSTNPKVMWMKMEKKVSMFESLPWGLVIWNAALYWNPYLRLRLRYSDLIEDILVTLSLLLVKTFFEIFSLFDGIPLVLTPIPLIRVWISVNISLLFLSWKVILTAEWYTYSIETNTNSFFDVILFLFYSTNLAQI